MLMKKIHSRGRRDDRRAEALEGPRPDQRCLRPRQPGEKRGQREHDQAREEDAPAPQQVGGASTEQQEAAEHERVCADHPLEILLRETEVDFDRGQRDVHDRDVQDDHELDCAQQRQRQPLALFRNCHVLTPFQVRSNSLRLYMFYFQKASTTFTTASGRATIPVM